MQKKQILLSKVIALVVVLCLVFAIVPIGPISRALAEGKPIKYVSIGDSMTNGYGLDGYETDGTVNGFLQKATGSYANLFQQYLNSSTGRAVDWTQLATSCLRAADLNFLLRYDYESGDNLATETDYYNYIEGKEGLNADYFTWEEFVDGRCWDWRDEVEAGVHDGVSGYAEVFQTAVSEADIISLAIGNADFGVFMLRSMMGVLNVPFGASDYQLDTQALLANADESVAELVEKATEIVLKYLPKTGLPMDDVMDEVLDVFTYAIANFAINYKLALDRISELNPDAEVMLVGLMNTMAGVKVVDDEGKVLFDLGGAMDALINVLDSYVVSVPAYAQLIGNKYEGMRFYFASNSSVETLTSTYDDEIDYEDADFTVAHQRIHRDIKGTILPLLSGMGLPFFNAEISLAEVKAGKDLLDKYNNGEIEASDLFTSQEASYPALMSAFYRSLEKAVCDCGASTNLNGNALMSLLGDFSSLLGGAFADANLQPSEELVGNKAQDLMDIAIEVALAGYNAEHSTSYAWNDIKDATEEPALSLKNGILDGAGQIAQANAGGFETANCLLNGVAEALENNAGTATLMCMFARFIAGDGIGSHPSANGHKELANSIIEAYEHDHTVESHILHTAVDFAKNYAESGFELLGQYLPEMIKEHGTEIVGVFGIIAVEAGLLTEEEALQYAQMAQLVVEAYEADPEGFRRELCIDLANYLKAKVLAKANLTEEQVKAILQMVEKVIDFVKEFDYEQFIETTKQQIVSYICENGPEMAEQFVLYSLEKGWITEEQIAYAMELVAKFQADPRGTAIELVEMAFDYAEENGLFTREDAKGAVEFAMGIYQYVATTEKEVLLAQALEQLEALWNATIGEKTGITSDLALEYLTKAQELVELVKNTSIEDLEAVLNAYLAQAQAKFEELKMMAGLIEYFSTHTYFFEENLSYLALGGNTVAAKNIGREEKAYYDIILDSLENVYKDAKFVDGSKDNLLPWEVVEYIVNNAQNIASANFITYQLDGSSFVSAMLADNVDWTKYLGNDLVNAIETAFAVVGELLEGNYETALNANSFIAQVEAVVSAKLAECSFELSEQDVANVLNACKNYVEIALQQAEASKPMIQAEILATVSALNALLNEQFEEALEVEEIARIKEFAEFAIAFIESDGALCPNGGELMALICEEFYKVNYFSKEDIAEWAKELQYCVDYVQEATALVHAQLEEVYACIQLKLAQLQAYAQGKLAEADEVLGFDLTSIEIPSGEAIVAYLEAEYGDEVALALQQAHMSGAEAQQQAEEFIKACANAINGASSALQSALETWQQIEPATKGLIANVAKKLVYTSIAYVTKTYESIEAIQAINPNATLVVLGMYNPMNGLVIKSGNVVIDLGKYAGMFVDFTNKCYKAYAMYDGGFTFVDVSGAETDEIGFIDATDFDVAKLAGIVMNLSGKLVANADGHAYIAERILEAVEFPEHYHEFGEWKEENGKHVRECACGEKETEDHEFGEWIENGNKHERTCIYCGAKETADHSWNAGVVTKQATHLEKGVKTFTCEVCGATKTEEIAKTSEHNFGDWTKKDDNQHERTCACGEKQTANHNWNDGVVTKEATHLEKGVKTYTCGTCGATKTEDIAKTTVHTFGEATYTWNGDKCTATRTCACGETSTDEVTGTWVVDSYATCTKAEKGHYEATFSSGKQLSAQMDKGSPLGHDYEKGVCKNCGAEDPNYEPPKGLSTGAIVGIAAGGTVVVGGGIFIALKFLKKKH